MSLQELSQIGEFLGGLSVLLTLVYLAIQIRGNTKAVRLAGAQQTNDALILAYRQLAENSELNRIFRSGTRDINSLTEDETGQFYAFWAATLFVAQNWLYQRDNGALDEELVMTFLLGLSGNFHADGFKSYWQERKFMYSKRLHDWVEDIISQPPNEGHTALGPSRER